MLHQPLTADPDVEQAIEDFAPVAGEIADRRRKLDGLKPAAADIETGYIDGLTADITAREARLGLFPGTLIPLIEARAAQAKSSGGYHNATYPASRSLLDAIRHAEEKVADAARVATLAKASLEAARAGLVAAQEAQRLFATRHQRVEEFA